ncbi:hypothetical protein Slin15195_G052540 [Septoria linicola]|uniref:Uncharacterized protein n=1 Tax=Septoria linicola TaxID=215465 RepID=A0A9Q9AMZ1_9PEZI|nr:hypothetical protein Slin15195_G052540 [Septoria linicola]
MSTNGRNSSSSEDIGVRREPTKCGYCSATFWENDDWLEHMLESEQDADYFKCTGCRFGHCTFGGIMGHIRTCQLAKTWFVNRGLDWLDEVTVEARCRRGKTKRDSDVVSIYDEDRA